VKLDHLQLRQLFPNASRSCIDANRSQDTGTPPKLERDSIPGTLGQVEAEARYTGRFLVRVTSVRKRLLDEDNICEKYHVDCCRYAGLIPTDSPSRVRIETTQRKCQKDEEEHVQIEILRAST